MERKHRIHIQHRPNQSLHCTTRKPSRRCNYKTSQQLLVIHKNGPIKRGRFYPCPMTTTTNMLLEKTSGYLKTFGSPFNTQSKILRMTWSSTRLIYGWTKEVYVGERVWILSPRIVDMYYWNLLLPESPSLIVNLHQ